MPLIYHGSQNRTKEIVHSTLILVKTKYILNGKGISLEKIYENKAEQKYHKIIMTKTDLNIDIWRFGIYELTQKEFEMELNNKCLMCEQR